MVSTELAYTTHIDSGNVMHVWCVAECGGSFMGLRMVVAGVVCIWLWSRGAWLQRVSSSVWLWRMWWEFGGSSGIWLWRVWWRWLCGGAWLLWICGPCQLWSLRWYHDICIYNAWELYWGLDNILLLRLWIAAISLKIMFSLCCNIC